MKKQIKRIILAILKVGICEKIFIMRVFHESSINNISAFRNEVHDQEFESHYQKYLPKLLNTKIPKIIQQKIIKCFCLNYFGDEKKEYNLIYQDVIDVFENLDFKAYGVDRWRTLNQFFISHGMFQVGDICREKAKERLLTRNKRWGDEWRKTVVYLEERQFDKVDNLIDRLERNFLFKIFLEEEIYALKLYYQLLLGAVIEKPDFFGEREKKYKEIVKDREILIMGPAPLKNGFPFENKDYIVIRNNELREELNEYKGARVTDIAYYNREIAILVQESKTEEFYDKFKFLVLKNKCEWNENIQNVRRAPHMDEVVFTGTLNVLPIMILDLWQFGIKTLYVCGNNLYLSKDIYEEGYIGAKVVRKKYIRWNSFSTHNMFSQHYLLKNLYLSKRLIPDKELELVLKLDSREYARQMEEIHVQKLREATGTENR